MSLSVGMERAQPDICRTLARQTHRSSPLSSQSNSRHPATGALSWAGIVREGYCGLRYRSRPRQVPSGEGKNHNL